MEVDEGKGEKRRGRRKRGRREEEEKRESEGRFLYLFAPRMTVTYDPWWQKSAVH